MQDNPIFSYTRRDYEASRQEGIAKIPIISKGVWTDLNASDPGIIILDYVHALVDMVNYYQDHQALETFITTAKERKNIFKLAKQLSYDIRSAKGAVCDVTFTSSIIYDHTIKIPKHTSVSTMSGIPYLTMEDAYLVAGEHAITIPCTQGKVNTTTYVGTGVSRFSNVPNAKNQSITLVAQNIDVSSIIITDSIGRLWSPVDYIIFSTELDRAYQVDLNPDDSVTIKFGDGERGIVPRDTDVLTISYMSSLADQGKVPANSIVNLDSQIRDGKDYIVEFMINNNKASSGGSRSQTSQEIRELAPGAIKAQNRAVTLSDFENLAKLVDGVSGAKAYDINTKPDLCLYHEVKVLITPTDTSSALDVLKTRVYDFLSQRMLPPTNLQVLTPSYVAIDVDIVVKKLETATEGYLSYNIQDTVERYFKSRESDIGEPFYPSDLLTELSILDGVRTIVSITPNSPVYAEDLSVITLGKLTITIQ